MALKNTIASISNHISQAYDALEEKGATIPAQKNLANLASAIETVSGGGGLFGDWGQISFKQDAEIITLPIENQVDFNTLASSSGASINIGGVSIARGDVLEVSLGKECRNIPSYFLRSCSALVSLKNTEVIESISDYFLCDCPLVSELILTNVKNIGVGFLRPVSTNTYASNPVNCNIVLGEQLISIDADFMLNCKNYNKPLRIPASVISIAGGFMCRCDNFTGPLTVETATVPNDPAGAKAICATNEGSRAYTTGVRLAGSGASTWKAALADVKDSANYTFRKLILAEN